MRIARPAGEHYNRFSESVRLCPVLGHSVKMLKTLEPHGIFFIKLCIILYHIFSKQRNVKMLITPDRECAG